MVRLTIDGNEVEVPEGATILAAARKAGVDIPTLCYHEGLEPYGACRLCVVEVLQRGRTRVESACTRPVEEGIEVHTDTPDLREYRRVTAELLLAQCPDSERLRDLARELGVGEVRFEPRDSRCILCGLCVRACADRIGTSAISFAHRGIDRRVATPFEAQSEVCIGCGACASVCPTGCIKLEDFGPTRYIRAIKTKLELEPCLDCGEYFVTKRLIERTAGEALVPQALLAICPACRRKRVARAIWEATQSSETARD